MHKIIRNWEEVIAQHQISGKSVPEFCREIGIHPNTFYKHRKRHQYDGESGIGLIELKPENHITACSCLTIKHRGFEISVSAGFDEKLLKSVLRIIGALG